MAFSQTVRAVGVFSTRQDTEDALNKLKNSGFPMHQVSAIAQNLEGDNEIAGVEVTSQDNKATGKGAVVGTAAGGMTGGLIGIIGALMTLTVPGVGPVVAGGAIASILGDALIGGAVGATTGGIVGAFTGLGIPEEQSRIYNERLLKGNHLVIIEGTLAEIDRATAIFSQQNLLEWEVYQS
ncbi:MAG: hypothetical protein KME06_15790 [Kastovskya adunca ATA6-11-RM4]|jgi:hypothetical protein|nr:hypothetical protein [Kastovskya adunca ATA6-11-RM4]